MAKLRHIAVTVPDPEKAAEFYIRAFGLRRVGKTDWEGAHGVYLTDGVMNIALLHYRKEEYAGARGRDFVGLHHFGFIVEDVAAARGAIEAAGGTHWMGEPAAGFIARRASSRRSTLPTALNLARSQGAPSRRARSSWLPPGATAPSARWRVCLPARRARSA